MSSLRELCHEKKHGTTGELVRIYAVIDLDRSDDGSAEMQIKVGAKRHDPAIPVLIADIHPSTRAAMKFPAGATVMVGHAFFGADGPEIVAKYHAAVARITAEFDRLVEAAEPVGYVFKRGCDTSNTYRPLFAADTGFAVQDRACRRGAGLIEKHLRGEDFDRVAEQTGAQAIPADLSIYYGYQFDRPGFDALLAIAQEREAAVELAAAQESEGRRKLEEDALATANESGKPVEINRWSEECDDPREECSLDIVTRVAYPDGSIQTRRQHTY